jgi:predicted peptidase
MKKTLILVLFFLYTFLVKAQNERFEAKEFVDSKGTNLKYRILLPENYDAKVKYPVLLFLHGAGERGDDNASQLTHGSAALLDFVKKTPAIVILPQCPKEDYWASVKFNRAKYPLDLDFNYNYDETKALHAAVELVKDFVKTKKADKKRIYITGLSMGGMGTFEAVFRYPKLFAAAAPICGGADVKSYEMMKSKIPFRIYHGDVDGVVPVKLSREITELMKAKKYDVVYKEYPGVNHNSWDNAFKETEYLSQLFAFKK